MSGLYDVDEMIVLVATFTDPARSRNDPLRFVTPTSVQMSARKPVSGDVVAVTVTPTTVGRYEGRIVVDEPGTWKWRAKATGNWQSVQEASFEVRRPAW